MDDFAIRVESLQQRFDQVHALRGIDAQIRSGCVTGLVGPDGAGKTTLMRLIAGLLKPTEGRIVVNGLDPIGQANALHDCLGYMPQKFGLYEDLSVMENLQLYADLRGLSRPDKQASFARLLAFTDLERFTSRAAGALSGGMKQKLGLACTLLGSPKVLLLDEPSVGVDPISRRELWRMVGELATHGMAIIWSTSYLDEAQRCRDVLLMSEGRLLYCGAPQELMDSMRGKSVQVRHIQGNSRRVLQRALRLPEVVDGVIQGDAVRLVLRQAQCPPPMPSLQAGDQAQIVAVEPRLEDAFVDRLGGHPGGDSVLAAHMHQAKLMPGLDTQAVIAARDLTKRFGDFVATDRVSFAVRRGEIFGLLGPNGAGKSTTFKMMCGLLKPSSGQASVMGIDLRRGASRARREIGYMAQKFALYGSLSVLQNLEFFSGIYGLRGDKRRAAVRSMIEVFDLQPHLQRDAAELPLGFKQRLALSCAIMHEPPLLFLDEPTSGVDPITRREFWTHINGLVEKGVTVMVTTHFMDEAEYCDRIGLVYRGRMIASGTPDALKAQARVAGEDDVTMEDAFIRLVEGADFDGEADGAVDPAATPRAQVAPA